MKSSFLKNLFVLILGLCLVLVKTDTSEAIYGENYSQIIWGYLEKLCALRVRLLKIRRGRENRDKEIRIQRRRSTNM